MPTFNIYGYENGQESDPYCVVILSEDNSEIVSVTSVNPEDQADAERSLRFYMDNGFTATDALFRYAGSYGLVKSAGPESEGLV